LTFFISKSFALRHQAALLQCSHILICSAP
jgi:hypothetical protein